MNWDKWYQEGVHIPELDLGGIRRHRDMSQSDSRVRPKPMSDDGREENSDR